MLFEKGYVVSRAVMVKTMECGIVESEFKIQSYY